MKFFLILISLLIFVRTHEIKENNLLHTNSSIQNIIFSSFQTAENSLLKKLSSRKINQIPSKRPIYHIQDIQTQINIPTNKCSANIKEIVKFRLSNGFFSLIIRKISLAGSANSLIAFKLSSKDILIKEVRIIRNCLNKPHEVKDLDENYLCVISIFDEVNALNSDVEISIKYEYIAQNIIKSTEDSNLAIWKYDNHLQETSINNVSLTYKFQEKFAIDNIMIANKEFFIHLKENTDGTNLSWKINKIERNKIFEFSFKNKKFNSNCEVFKYRKSDHKTGLDYTFIIFLFFSTVFMMIYISQNEFDKHQRLTVSMEIEKIKKLAESNSVNDRILQDNATYYEQYNYTG